MTIGDSAISGVGHRPVVGEKLVVVIPSYSNGRPPTVAEGTVTKVGREFVYMTIEGGHLREPKFRIRTQYTENGTNYNARYLTREQREVELAVKGAKDTLLRHMVELGWGSKFRKNPELMIRLASAVDEIMGNETGGPSLAPEGSQG